MNKIIGVLLATIALLLGGWSVFSFMGLVFEAIAAPQLDAELIGNYTANIIIYLIAGLLAYNLFDSAKDRFKPAE